MQVTKSIAASKDQLVTVEGYTTTGVVDKVVDADQVVDASIGALSNGTPALAPNPNSDGGADGGGGSMVIGAAAGGAVGGVLVLAIAVFVIRRKQVSRGKKDTQFSAEPSPRAAGGGLLQQGMTEQQMDAYPNNNQQVNTYPSNNQQANAYPSRHDYSNSYCGGMKQPATAQPEDFAPTAPPLPQDGSSTRAGHGVVYIPPLNGIK